jgi:hypothetical protein
MHYFKNTQNWVRKTNENIYYTQEYVKKCETKDDVSMFPVHKHRHIVSLVPKHSIETCNQDLFAFVNETLQMCADLQRRIDELENRA